MMAFANAMAVVISGMMNRYIIIGITLLLLSCGNGKGGKVNELYDGGHGNGIDTAAIHVIQCQEEIANEPVKESANDVAPAPSRHDNHEPDNMRGFDPPSEDDMDDNGMTRYMEVNDDEGWE